ncbi:MAG: hypothetical protein JHC95_17655 [Solirubrobacteraceae bacterium]|nr:hypothetical protein [Solirubrobacteraceae bacterium]
MLRRLAVLSSCVAAALIALPAAAGAAPVTGAQTALALDPGAAAALSSLGVRVQPTTAATVDDEGRVVFPVTGGALSSDLKGTVTHTGGLLLKKGFIPINVQRFTIDLRGEPKLNAELRYAGLRFDLAKLTNISVAPGEGGATVVTADVNLTAFAASVLNFAFGTTAIKPGLKLGTAEATVTLGADG